MSLERRIFFSSGILSPYKARKQAQKWTEFHDYRFLKDGSGFIWRVELEALQRPFEKDLKSLIWTLSAHIFQEIKADELVACGALDSKKDQRLLAFLGQEKFFLSMKPYIFSALKEDEVKRKFEAFFPKLKAIFASDYFYQQKRASVESWIETMTSFGGRDGFFTSSR